MTWGSDFAFGKFAHAAPELLLFVGEGKIHVASRVSMEVKEIAIADQRIFYTKSARFEDYQPTG